MKIHAVALSLVALAAQLAHAADAPGVDAPVSTLERILSTREILVGVLDNALPFAV